MKSRHIPLWINGDAWRLILSGSALSVDMSSIDVPASTEEISLVRSLFSVSVEEIKPRRKVWRAAAHVMCCSYVFENDRRKKNCSVPVQLHQQRSRILLNPGYVIQ